ncbi:inositol monophosphatase family protein [uncultured Bacteroides sp.]|uniref:inositol monophosphatase family protein n=1 Tax=uncultured Bacteroides sp. TaxID=162156 RepID=UPI002AA8C534|nr:inositol monophosphatase family protein [uncultured Bacteroides sp.]
MNLNPKNNSDLAYITKCVCKIAIEGGAFLQDERHKFKRERVEEKNSHDYVSYVDKESERRLVSQLSALLPEAGFIAEEGSATLADEQYCWVIDPLDGTTNFIHDNAPYCVSIALRNKYEVLLGVVYEVCRNECFHAYKDAPAYLNDKEIRVSEVSSLNDAFIELGLPYNFNAYKPMADYLIHTLYGKVGGTRIQGSAAAELCYIAAGRFEARIEQFLGPWDVAAGSIILKNAGGKITDFSDEDSFYSGNEVLATNGKIHQSLLDIIHLFHP